MDITTIKDKISNTLSRYTGESPSTMLEILPTTLGSMQGKLYEAHVLAYLIENLVTKEGFIVKFMHGTKLTLKQKGSIINKAYPYFEVWKGPLHFGNIFTDTYFSTISYEQVNFPAGLYDGDFHEIDIILVSPDATNYVEPNQIKIAIECKNTTITKSIIREILGFRRELSLLDFSNTTSFNSWPTRLINANPSSIHMLFCSDKKVIDYEKNCNYFGTLLVHFIM